MSRTHYAHVSLVKFASEVSTAINLASLVVLKVVTAKRHHSADAASERGESNISVQTPSFPVGFSY